MLMVNHLHGFNVRPADVTVSYLTNATNASDLSTYTFSSTSLGAAASDRTIVVGVFVSHTTLPSITSLTVAGITATEIVTITDGNGRASLYQVSVPTGTTGDIVVTCSSTSFRASIGVWAVYGSSGVVRSQTSTTNPASLSLFIDGGGVAIGFIAANGAAARTFTWGTLTENFDGVAEATATFSGGSLSVASAQTPTISITPSDTTTFLVSAAASFR